MQLCADSRPGDRHEGLEMREAVKPVTMTQIEAARGRLEGLCLESPLVACGAAPAGKNILLKLENLQAIGSFKVRPIGNAVLSRAAADLSAGIYTTSAGNSALGVAWMARRLGIAATAVVPTNAPPAKLDKLRQLGTHIDMRRPEDWWHAIETGDLEGQKGVYIDAVRDPASLAGDATIGLEVLAQSPDIEAILIPFGGGGLACGIACAAREMRRDVRIIACELQSAQPLRSAFALGAPTPTAHEAGFVSGVGFGTVLPEMWPLLKAMIDEVITVSLDQVAAAIKIMAEHNHIVAEGAGAVSVAAALFGRYAESKVCAVVSGGNIDSSVLAAILEGRTPGRP
jgi:threonine dehydratase